MSSLNSRLAPTLVTERPAGGEIAREELIDTFLDRIERRRRTLSESLDDDQRATLGQFFTPVAAARLIADMVTLPDEGTVRVLDPGAGMGSLTAAFVARVLRDCPRLTVSLCVVEIDPALVPHLHRTLQECHDLASDLSVKFEFEVRTGDLVEIATGWNREFFERFDIVIMNPPYRKLPAHSVQRRSLAQLGVDSPNLYTTFLAIGVLSLIPGGQVAAITPRSFANGPYFAKFRRFLLSQASIERLHVFESRSTVFGDAGVLQENIVLSARKWTKPGTVTLSVSNGHTDALETREVDYREIVRPGDPQEFLRIPAKNDDTIATDLVSTLPCSLINLGLQVSTGKVVDFRAREYLLRDASDCSVPLVYPVNVKKGRVCWPLRISKPQALALRTTTRKLVLPHERYVLVKRFSAKEERRRVVAAIYDPAGMPGEGVAFENHLNVFHIDGHGLDERLALGLSIWLNSSTVDRYFRTFSGHTQVNATDLRSLRYPSREQLVKMGALVNDDWPGQVEIDAYVREYVLKKQDA